MYWAKNQPTVRYPLGSSEVPHFRLDRLPIAVADLELDGASHYRYRRCAGRSPTRRASIPSGW